MIINFIKTSLIVYLLLIPFFGTAQGTVAHISIDEVIAAMPVTRTAEAEIKRIEETYREDFIASYREYQSKLTNFEEQKDTMTPQQRTQEESEIKLIERNLAQEQQNIDKNIAEKRKTVMAPIRQKAIALVNQVADSQGFLYVFDTSGESNMIMAKGKNLLQDVLRRL